MKYLFLILILSFSNLIFAEEDIVLKLNCNISFEGHMFVSEEVILSNYKNKDGGSKKLIETKEFEFWVMTHGIQRLNNQLLYNNFQVAIKDKNSSVFAHALSDTNNYPDSFPKQARISLVDYHPNTMQEAGEIMFECVNL